MLSVNEAALNVALPEIRRQFPHMNEGNVGIISNSKPEFTGRQISKARSRHLPSGIGNSIITRPVKQIKALRAGRATKVRCGIVAAATDAKMPSRNMQCLDELKCELTVSDVPRVNLLNHR